MKTLILTRHAKSSWDDLNLLDHERKLNTRGQQAAGTIGRWLTQQGHVPDQIISSDAQRCKETWALLSAELPETPEPSFHRRLYLAAPVTQYEALKQAKGDRVMMLGHNPGIAQFAHDLLAPNAIPDHPKFGLYPTAATLVVSFDIPDWSTPFMGSGQVVDFVVPRELDA
ncbi:SixA phosphatase family protein [Neptunicoccus sediminis]|uniref:SixA phosphatase family protein n=1 Tax=Neptunicoccus sediminis TaxID=1892596 RepID=UPI0008460409|nr:histidine phosphatase family protein [Neptunicoccus sediminis]